MKLLGISAVTLAVLVAGCGSSNSSSSSTTATSGSSSSGSSSSGTITGAGSTFDLPFFSKAFAVYQKNHHVTVNYQPVGSGAGIQQFTNKTVDFGASDVPMDSSELPAAQKAWGKVDEVPVALGGVAVAYNLKGVSRRIKIDGPTLAQIYMGQITKWNDPALTRLNPGVTLPSQTITVAHRSDASGTSYIFTDYLSHVSSAWKSKVGTGKLPNWPAGVGGKGNPGVAQIVQSTPGAIGYVELAYVIQNHISSALVRNAAGTYVAPTQSSVAAAASKFPNVNAQNFSIVDATGVHSYPIAGYSWALLPGKGASKAMVALFQWIVTGGQSYASKVDYVPLPSGVRQNARTKLNSIAM